MPDIEQKGPSSRSSTGKKQTETERIMGELKSAEASLKQSKKAPKAKKVEYLAVHTVASGETLSHIALKYYKSAAREKWMAIYEANKATIGDNPSMIKVGQKLNIPQLPE
jgi:nucleoid-associated protein YgaU